MPISGTSDYILTKSGLILSRGINRDSRYYSDASEFLPERFTSDHIELDPSTSIFGFGRRACVGAQYAIGVLSMNVASILSVYSISTEDLNVEPSFSGGVLPILSAAALVAQWFHRPHKVNFQLIPISRLRAHHSSQPCRTNPLHHQTENDLSRTAHSGNLKK